MVTTAVLEPGDEIRANEAFKAKLKKQIAEEPEAEDPFAI